ncbi:hypothetical protein ACLB2K_030755 [Fragaria x ananassa]
MAGSRHILTGTIGASCAKHEQEQDSDKVKRWRAALTSVASLTGWHTESHKDQTALINDIVQSLQRCIFRKEMATSSAEWNFLLFTLILEILSAGFDQASSPSKPHYALIAMLLAAAAVFTCIWELIQKKSLVLKSWKKTTISYPHLSDTFFESHLDIYGLVSSIYQCVFSTVQYINAPYLPSISCVWLVQDYGRSTIP